jgi:hypothetical protein
MHTLTPQMHFSNSPIRTRRRSTRPRSSLWRRVELWTFLKLPPSSVTVPTGTGELALLRGHQRALHVPLRPHVNFSHLLPNVQCALWALQNSVLPCTLLPHPSTRHLFPPPTAYAEVLRPLPRCSAGCLAVCAPASPLPAGMHLIVGDSD